MASEIADITALADKWAERFTSTIAQYGPDAAQLALEVGRVGAIKELVLAGGGVVCGAVLIRAAFWAARKVVNEIKSPTGDMLYRSNDERDVNPVVVVPCGVVCAVSAVFGVPMALIHATKFLDPFIWIGLFRPEVYLAAKAVGL